MASVGEGTAEVSHSGLASEVLQISNLLAQQSSNKSGGSYKFSMNDFEDGDSNESFELNRDDALQLIGVLNSRERDIAKRELSSLLARLDRRAVEGIVRRLYATLQRKNQEIAQLETEAAGSKKIKGPGAGRSTSLPGQPKRRLQSPRGDSQTLPGAVESQSKDSLVAPRSPRDSCASGTLFSPRRAKEGGQYQSFKAMQEQQQAEYLKFLQERAGCRPEEGSPRGSASPRDSARMPQVFRRLTAPATPPSDQMARIAVAHMGANKAQVSFGGALAESSDASQYLDALLEAHHSEVAARAEDLTTYIKQSPRVSEEKAREIFDRLYKNGKDARVRRRVYAELGLLVEQAKEAQLCTFEPRLPLAKYPDGFQPQESVNERLYRDSFERRRRRQEAKQSVPLPSFRPNASINSTTSRRSEGGMSPRDTVCSEGLGFDDGRLTAEGSSRRQNSPTHERLFRDHADRRARQAHREDAMADWRKHTFKPDISMSQATGPQIARSGNFLDQLETGRSDEDGGDLQTFTISGRPTVPIRTSTHPAFDQELSDEEDYKVMQDSNFESPSKDMSSIEATSPIEQASSYKLHPAAAAQQAAKEEEDHYDYEQPALSAEPELPETQDIGQPQEAEEPPAAAAADVDAAASSESKAQPAEEETYDMPAVDKLSEVCKDLRAESEKTGAQPSDLDYRTPDMYLNPQGPEPPSGQASRQTSRDMQPVRRQWVQTQPQLPSAAAAAAAAATAVRQTSPDMKTSPELPVSVSRQDSAYSASGYSQSNSPSVPYRHFSGRILTPRESSGNISVVSNGRPGNFSPRTAFIGTAGQPTSIPVSQPPGFVASQPQVQPAGVVFAAWPAGSTQVQDAAPQVASPGLPVQSPRGVVSPGLPARLPANRYIPQPQQVITPIPFQAQQPHHPTMQFSPRGMWQVPTMPQVLR